MPFEAAIYGRLTAACFFAQKEILQKSDNTGLRFMTDLYVVAICVYGYAFNYRRELDRIEK